MTNHTKVQYSAFAGYQVCVARNQIKIIKTIRTIMQSLTNSAYQVFQFEKPNTILDSQVVIFVQIIADWGNHWRNLAGSFGEIEVSVQKKTHPASNFGLLLP